MDKVVGCGIDIEELDRFEKYFKSGNKYSGNIPQIVNDIFTHKEIKKNFIDNSVLRLTLGFACKEAVFKSFGLSWLNSEIYWQDIELLFKKNKNINHYSIKLNGFALKFYKQLKCKKIISSISFNNYFVVFKVILLR